MEGHGGVKEQVKTKSVLLLMWGWTGLDACCEMVSVEEWVCFVCDDSFFWGGVLPDENLFSRGGCCMAFSSAAGGGKSARVWILNGVFSLIQTSFDNRTKCKRVNPHGVLTWL